MLSLRIAPAALIALAALHGPGTARPLAQPAPTTTQAARETRVDAARLMKDLEALAAPAMQGRLTGTAGSKRAQAYILEQFKQLKLQPFKGGFEQKFAFTSRRGGTQEFPDAVNLFGMLPGTVERDRYVLVTAHYDHLGARDGAVYHGADDNASGVAAMLAAARWFSARPPRVSLLFVAFDAEEQGLQGARYFVEHPPVPIERMSAVVNMDMVGRGDKNVIYVAGTTPYPALKPLVEAAAKGRPIQVRFGHDRPGVAGVEDWTQSSDHGPFHNAHVPFLYFGVEDHADYHKPTDTFDKIDRAFFFQVVATIVDAIGTLDRALPAVRQ